MSLLTDIREKVSNSKQEQKDKSYDEEMRNLDLMIEDLFKMDSTIEKKAKQSDDS
jgi:hypothetical protein